MGHSIHLEEGEFYMTEWILKKLAVRAINRLLKRLEWNLDSGLELLDNWMRRVQRICSLMQSLKKRVKDHNITDDELEETINDIKTTVEEW